MSRAPVDDSLSLGFGSFVRRATTSRQLQKAGPVCATEQKAQGTSADTVSENITSAAFGFDREPIS